MPVAEIGSRRARSRERNSLSGRSSAFFDGRDLARRRIRRRGAMRGGCEDEAPSCRHNAARRDASRRRAGGRRGNAGSAIVTVPARPMRLPDVSGAGGLPTPSVPDGPRARCTRPGRLPSRAAPPSAWPTPRVGLRSRRRPRVSRASATRDVATSARSALAAAGARYVARSSKAAGRPRRRGATSGGMARRSATSPSAHRRPRAMPRPPAEDAGRQVGGGRGVPGPGAVDSGGDVMAADGAALSGSAPRRRSRQDGSPPMSGAWSSTETPPPTRSSRHPRPRPASRAPGRHPRWCRGGHRNGDGDIASGDSAWERSPPTAPMPSPSARSAGRRHRHRPPRRGLRASDTHHAWATLSISTSAVRRRGWSADGRRAGARVSVRSDVDDVRRWVPVPRRGVGTSASPPRACDDGTGSSPRRAGGPAARVRRPGVAATSLDGGRAGRGNRAPTSVPAGRRLLRRHREIAGATGPTRGEDDGGERAGTRDGRRGSGWTGRRAVDGARRSAPVPPGGAATSSNLPRHGPASPLRVSVVGRNACPRRSGHVSASARRPRTAPGARTGHAPGASSAATSRLRWERRSGVDIATRARHRRGRPRVERAPSARVCFAGSGVLRATLLSKRRAVRAPSALDAMPRAHPPTTSSTWPRPVPDAPQRMSPPSDADPAPSSRRRFRSESSRVRVAIPTRGPRRPRRDTRGDVDIHVDDPRSPSTRHESPGDIDDASADDADDVDPYAPTSMSTRTMRERTRDDRPSRRESSDGIDDVFA